MHATLSEMKELYPAEWKEMEACAPLLTVIKNYYRVMGLELLENADKGLYVSVPFTFDTLPSFSCG